MPEPEDEDVVARKVVYETRSTSTNRGTGIAFALVGIVALALIIWVVMQMR